MSGRPIRRTTLCAVMLSAGLLAASEASAAAPRVTRQEPMASPWTRPVEGFFQSVHAKNGNPPGQHPPGQKPQGSSREGSGLCPFGNPNRPGNSSGGGN
jgi:hypothetical protein